MTRLLSVALIALICSCHAKKNIDVKSAYQEREEQAEKIRVELPEDEDLDDLPEAGDTGGKNEVY